jgi:endonuclease-3
MKRIRGLNSDKTAVQAQWREVYDTLMEVRRQTQAPVDTMGVEMTPDRTQGEGVFRFQSLVSLILSAQTKDETNASTHHSEIMTRLQKYGLTVDHIVDTAQDQLVDLIRDAGFHNNKAKSIKRVAQIIKDEYDGLAPETYEEVIALPGIGPKMTLLYLQVVRPS